VGPETAFRDRRRRVFRVVPSSNHPGSIVSGSGGCCGGCSAP
jgi:hypothetical protein